MNTTGARERQFTESLDDKEYRDAMVTEHLKNHLAFQIQAMRVARGWTQEDLGRAAGMRQEQISRLEDPDYGSYTLKTLFRIAAAFDVAFLAAFAPFSELVSVLADLSIENLNVPSFAEDEHLRVSGSSTYHLGEIIETSTIQVADLVATSTYATFHRTGHTPYAPILAS